MRWDALFGDLDAQLHAAEQQDLECKVNELARVEESQTTLADALRGALGQEVAAVLRNGIVHRGCLQRVAAQWLLLEEANQSVVLPISKLLKVSGLGFARVPERGHMNLSLASVLRLLARDRAVVVLELDATAPQSMRGVLDQVGADFFLLMQLADGVGRGRDNQQGSIIVPLEAVLSVSSRGENSR
ncbi:hypothetical protein [Arthrobacter cryoconiti]|uniref:Uncharacterized protein n=1 Tax=Arthrobacter cryoconiti TaxID=748907 RepID=A0ABV8QYT6_9MICC|nr:hypothetical protein [Arthrobacter cryoconiti]MCC9068448.1 hypothetical protein [Arthrobacter cryoconiti]